MSLSFYESQGAKLAYSDDGSGLPVVFLHPTPLDHFYWRPLMGRLNGVRAIVPDLRGHGASELGCGLPLGGFARVPDAPTLTIAQLASDILLLLDHLSLSAAVFTGCSIGGYVLLELWRRAPERVHLSVPNRSPMPKRILLSAPRPSQRLAKAARKRSSMAWRKR
jgi:pimeloyl-ACP methyl ester carboxylesterase